MKRVLKTPKDCTQVYSTLHEKLSRVVSVNSVRLVMHHTVCVMTVLITILLDVWSRRCILTEFTTCRTYLLIIFVCKDGADNNSA